ncbi:MAG: glycosyl transferase GT17 family protein, partial [Butyrivibrio sp.]|nr:glycosyl transferase GT17 family protein [Butyrivibrio sp.]
MVYDLIPFFNEIDILKLRLGILDPYVDKFIIEEAT